MGPITNVVHHDLNLHFQGHEVLNVNFSIYEWISQTAIDSHTIPTDLQSTVRGTIKLYRFPKILHPFPTFPGEVQTTYSQFSRKLFD